MSDKSQITYIPAQPNEYLWELSEIDAGEFYNTKHRIIAWAIETDEEADNGCRVLPVTYEGIKRPDRWSDEIQSLLVVEWEGRFYSLDNGLGISSYPNLDSAQDELSRRVRHAEQLAWERFQKEHPETEREQGAAQ